MGSKEVCFLVEGRHWLESSQMKGTDWQAGWSAQVWHYIQNICWRDYLRETWNMESSLFPSLFSLSSFSSLVNLTFNSATWCWIEEHILLNQLTKSLISEKNSFWCSYIWVAHHQLLVSAPSQPVCTWQCVFAWSGESDTFTFSRNRFLFYVLWFVGLKSEALK